MGNDTRPKNQPAFPLVGISDGMSLRDYFAGQAVVGLLSDPRFDVDPNEGARLAYRWADAMANAREGGK